MVPEFANTLNEALCERHSQRCQLPDGSVHPTVLTECHKTFANAEEIRRELLALGAHAPGSEHSLCRDLDDRCPGWAEGGDCDSNAGALLIIASHRAPLYDQRFDPAVAAAAWAGEKVRSVNRKPDSPCQIVC